MSHFTHTDYKWTNAVRPGFSVNEGEEKHWHAVASTGSSFPVPISISQCEGDHPAPGVLINAFCTGQREAVRKLKSKCWLLRFCYRRCSYLDWHQPLRDRRRPAHGYSQPVFLFFCLKYHPSPLKSPSLVHCAYLDVFCRQTSSSLQKKPQISTVLSPPWRSGFTDS